MTFDQAFSAMHMGKRMTRSGLEGLIDYISSPEVTPGLAVTCDGRTNSWRPSKADLDAKDWEEVTGTHATPT